MMGNRYTKTGFTSREEYQLRQYRKRIMDILAERRDKQDSPEVFRLLMRAADNIYYALEESKRWKNQ